MTNTDFDFPDIERISAEEEFSPVYSANWSIAEMIAAHPDVLDDAPQTEGKDDMLNWLRSFKASLGPEDPGVRRNLEESFRKDEAATLKRRIEMSEYTRDDDKPLVYSAADLLAAGKAAGDPFRVEGFWPIGGRMNVFAQPKVGKSTLMGELVYCLLTGEPFLDTQVVKPLKGSVCVIDVELTDREALTVYEKAMNWTVDNDPSRFVFAPLLGRASMFNVTDPETRRELAQQYSGHEVYILDCAGPLAAALGLDENSNTDVQRLLSGFDEFVRLAGGPGAESVAVHHAGKTSGLPRGATAWEGSGSANVILTADSASPSSPRFIEVRGGRGEMFDEKRRVLLGEEPGRLVMGDKAAKRGTGAASQYVPPTDDAEAYVLEYLSENDAAARWDVIRKKGKPTDLTQKTIQRALEELIDSGQVVEDAPAQGSGKKALHVSDGPLGGEEPLL